MATLSPYLDDMGILRVGGHIHLFSLPIEARHPILLPAKHIFTQRLFEWEHNNLLHCGPQHLLAQIRQNYWPLGGRNMARKVVRSCIRCFRVKLQQAIPIMGNLPSQRFNPTFPFIVTGVDYAGPILIRSKQGRGAKLIKAYISLFICLSTKAIHIEIVSDLTTDSFISSLRRFIARRGKPKEILSDNGSNFKDAANQLNSLYDFLNSKSKTIVQHIAHEGIKWTFIPPNSPHFGGIWEAGVKSVKHHLRRVVGNAHLTIESLNTLLVQVEAVLNSRPLCILSTDPNDPLPLTPSHFLLGRSLQDLPEYDLRHTASNRLSHYQQRQQLLQHFWQSWSKEYVSLLQQRQNWNQTYKNLEIGTVVLIKDDHQPPLCWILGIVTHLYPGNDGVVRVVTLRTAKGDIKRSVHKVCPLATSTD